MSIEKKYYKIKPSPIHNRGLFARTFIPEGTQVIEYIGEKITKAEAQRRAEAWDKKTRNRDLGLVYIFELNQRYDIDGSVPNNTARYINHSCDPNCEAEVKRGHIWISAIRDIEKDEELSFDYGYDMEHFMEHPCQCGADNCLGYIVREDQRRRVRALLRRKKKSLKDS